MFVARLWFLTHTVVRQGYHLGPRLFRRSYDAGVSEWHAELDQHPWPQRVTCTCESDTLLSSAVLLATGGYADDLAGTCIVRSHTELDDIDQLTTSSLAAAWRRRALQLHPEKGVTATRYLGAQRTIEGTVTTERAARCAAARTLFAQYWQPYRSRTHSHLRRVVFQATVVGALSFGLEVACLIDVDVRVVHGCFVPLFYKFSGCDAYRFEHGRNRRLNQCREGNATGSIVVFFF